MRIDSLCCRGTVYQAERTVINSKDLVILDTDATISLFVNEDLLMDVKEVKPICVTAITPEKLVAKVLHFLFCLIRV